MRRVYGFPAILLLVGAAALSAQPAVAQETVAVSLNGAPFEVLVKPSSVAAGAVDFEVINDGAGLPHNLRVIRTDLAPDALPVDGDTNMVDESRVDVVASSQDLLQGETETVSATLPGGSYVLICNLPSHYLAGQYTAFSVTGTLPPTETPIPADTATPAPTDATPTDGEPAAATATPATGITQLPETGAGADGSLGRWWPLVVGLGATGAALSGLGALATRRRWRGE